MLGLGLKGKQAEARFPLFTSAAIASLLYRPEIIAESCLLFTPFFFLQPIHRACIPSGVWGWQ
jgi:hypothetical protein